jgi:hypothetical protein
MAFLLAEKGSPKAYRMPPETNLDVFIPPGRSGVKEKFGLFAFLFSLRIMPLGSGF